MSIAPLGPESLGIRPESTRPAERPSTPAQDPFSATLTRAGAAIAEGQTTAEKALESFASGAQGNLHETLLAVDKADISLKLLVTVRNRLLDTYREIMRMGA